MNLRRGVELIKAIEVMQRKLDVNDRLIDVLSCARLALTEIIS
jgi:hypothetical protein